MIERAKMHKSGVPATAFMSLGGRDGDFKEGVWLVWWGFKGFLKSRQKAKFLTLSLNNGSM